METLTNSEFLLTLTRFAPAGAGILEWSEGNAMCLLKFRLVLPCDMWIGILLVRLRTRYVRYRRVNLNTAVRVATNRPYQFNDS